MKTKMKSSQDTIFNYSGLSSIQLTGQNLTVLIHSDIEPDQMNRDLYLIARAPLVRRSLVAANSA